MTWSGWIQRWPISLQHLFVDQTTYLSVWCSTHLWKHFAINKVSESLWTYGDEWLLTDHTSGSKSPLCRRSEHMMIFHGDSRDRMAHLRTRAWKPDKSFSPSLRAQHCLMAPPPTWMAGCVGVSHLLPVHNGESDVHMYFAYCFLSFSHPILVVPWCVLSCWGWAVRNCHGDKQITLNNAGNVRNCHSGGDTAPNFRVALKHPIKEDKQMCSSAVT